MNSSYYKGLIDKYKSIISKISSLNSNVDNSLSSINTCKNRVIKNQISGQAIDNDMLNHISSSLVELKGAADGVIAECNMKIEYYEVLYTSALQAESRRTSSDDSFVK